MKFVLGLLVGVAAVYAVSAWVVVTPQRLVKDWQNAAAVASIAATLALSPLASNAATVNVAGSYADPNHPNCQRIITSASSSLESSEIILTGTDGNPGCPPDGSGTSWQLMGSVQGSDVFVDFSPKGGPKDLKGVYNEETRAILWPDGNTWTQKN
jgi:hypothetical protein